MRIDFRKVLFLLFTLLIITPRDLRADTITPAGGESITWNFQGIPQTSFFGSGSCYYYSETNFWSCDYGMTDPPYGNEITFTASMHPTAATYPAFTFGYYDAYNSFHFVSRKQWVGAVPMDLAVSYFIPASARKFALLYHSNGSGGSGTNIQINWQIANYDPVRANLLGGDDISPDTEYCDENPQPGQPRIRKFRNKKGAGPGT
jgi:hypothetical protein